ncbi:MAG: DEAD/DEAH box helicase [Ignavibacteriaceae bacterium]
MFFSATMPEAIVKLSKNILTNPVKIEISPESNTVDAITQGVYFVSKPDKKALLIHLLKKESITSALVFTRTKSGADQVTRILNNAKINADAIHGNKSQNARQKALNNFKDKKVRVLVATDIAARGIDIDQLSHVINYEIPEFSENYVHRIGRTGRAGLTGTALSFCDSEERYYLREINKYIKKSIPVIADHPYAIKGVDEVTFSGAPKRPSRSGKSFASKKAGFSRSGAGFSRKKQWGRKSRAEGKV